MAKKNIFSLFRFASEAGKAIDEMNTKKVMKKQKKTNGVKQATGLLRKELEYKTFRHNQQYEMCQWVNKHNIEVASVASDGNSMNLFYWKTVLNN